MVEGKAVCIRFMIFYFLIPIATFFISLIVQSLNFFLVSNFLSYFVIIIIVFLQYQYFLKEIKKTYIDFSTEWLTFGKLEKFLLSKQNKLYLEKIKKHQKKVLYVLAYFIEIIGLTLLRLFL